MRRKQGGIITDFVLLRLTTLIECRNILQKHGLHVPTQSPWPPYLGILLPPLARSCRRASALPRLLPVLAFRSPGGLVLAWFSWPHHHPPVLVDIEALLLPLARLLRLCPSWSLWFSSSDLLSLQPPMSSEGRGEGNMGGSTEEIRIKSKSRL